MSKAIYINALQDKVKNVCHEHERLKLEEKSQVKLIAHISKQLCDGNNGGGKNSEKMERDIHNKY